MTEDEYKPPYMDLPQEEVNKRITAYQERGWNIDEYSLTSPSGIVFRIDGSDLDDGSGIDYEFLTDDGQREWNEASDILDLMDASYDYLRFPRPLF